MADIVFWCFGSLFCFPRVLCITELSDGGICSSNFRAAWDKTAALLTCGR